MQMQEFDKEIFTWGDGTVVYLFHALPKQMVPVERVSLFSQMSNKYHILVGL